VDDKVEWNYTVNHIDYNKVQGNATMVNDIKDGIKTAVLSGLPAGYTKDLIEVTLSAGSVVALVSVTPRAGSTASQLHGSIDSSAQESMRAKVNEEILDVPNLDTVLTAGQSLDDITITSEAPSMVTKPYEDPLDHSSGFSFCFGLAISGLSVMISDFSAIAG